MQPSPWVQAEYNGGIMGQGCKEAGVVEASVRCRLAVPGDKRLRPGWPL